MVFTEQQMLRYARHIVLPEIGGTGQAQLLDAKVLLVGAGGLGSPLALYLAAAGVGTLGIVDHDRVELSNLHRQIAHPTTQVGMAKTESATLAAHALNPETVIHRHDLKIDPDNA
ncbi:MAG: HesA/MoeB/ThiF family protein, partial [Geminicoccaceae bacterium]